MDPNEGAQTFKAQIFALTGVPPERQKIIAKGAWVGVLKDDADMSKMTIADGQVMTLMGTADVVVAPKTEILFVEDMTDAQKAEKGAVFPAGMLNLGNTCYMNSILQCTRSMGEMRNALVPVRSNINNPNTALAVRLRDQLDELDRY